MLSVNKVVKENERLVLFDGSRLYDVPLERVICFSQKGRIMTMRYELRDKENGIEKSSIEAVSIYHRLKDISEMLDESFLKCGRSNIVNMRHIGEITDEGVRLPGSMEIDLGSELLRRVRKEYLLYRRANMGESKKD